MSSYLNGYTLLNQFRQIPQTFGRALLGLLLFVWLSMAISPCVMANSVMPGNGNGDVADMAVVHADMDKCNYCPDDSMNTELCQNIHNIVSDSVTFVIDSIDTESFILFEIPAASSIAQLTTINNIAKLQNIPDQTISPLALTGILRI